MKKRNMAALALLAVMLLTACGRAADAAVTTGEIVVPEMSSKDMLVNSLEYLLEEESEEETGEERKETEEVREKEPEEKTYLGNEDENYTPVAVICYGRDMDSDLTREEITPA